MIAHWTSLNFEDLLPEIMPTAFLFQEMFLAQHIETKFLIPILYSSQQQVILLECAVIQYLASFPSLEPNMLLFEYPMILYLIFSPFPHQHLHCSPFSSAGKWYQISFTFNLTNSAPDSLFLPVPTLVGEGRFKFSLYILLQQIIDIMIPSKSSETQIANSGDAARHN